MSASKDSLIQLILSLSKQEKRYFKLYASRHLLHGKSNYIELFDILAARPEISNKELKAEYPQATFIKNIANTKYELNRLILKSLHAFYAEASPQSRLNIMMHQVEILYNKGLFENAKKILEKARKLAAQFELLSGILEILDWETRLIPYILPVSKVNAAIIEVGAERLKWLEGLRLQLFFQKCLAEVKQMMLNTPKEELRKYEPELRKMLQLPELADPKPALTYQEGFLYFEIWATCLREVGELKTSIAERAAMVEFMESRPELLPLYLDEYISTLSKLVVYKAEQMDFQHYEATLAKLRSVEQRFPDQVSEATRLHIFTRTWLLELSMYNALGQFDRIREVYPVFEAGMQQYGKKVNAGLKLQYASIIIQLWIGCGDYERALTDITRILAEVPANLFKDTQANIRLLQILVYYEMGREDILPPLLRSIYRFMLKMEELSPRDRHILAFIRNDLPKSAGRIGLRNALRNLARRLKVDDSWDLERGKGLEFDLEAWIESKLSGEDFAKLVQLGLK